MVHLNFRRICSGVGSLLFLPVGCLPMKVSWNRLKIFWALVSLGLHGVVLVTRRYPIHCISLYWKEDSLLGWAVTAINCLCSELLRWWTVTLAGSRSKRWTSVLTCGSLTISLAWLSIGTDGIQKTCLWVVKAYRWHWALLLRWATTVAWGPKAGNCRPTSTIVSLTDWASMLWHLYPMQLPT